MVEWQSSPTETHSIGQLEFKEHVILKLFQCKSCNNSNCCGCRAIVVWLSMAINEEADRRAGESGRLDRPVDRACGRGRSRRAKIRREMVCEPIRHEKLRVVYSGELRETEEASLPRQDRVNLTRPSLGRWRAIVGRTEDLTWRLCQMREGNAEHIWLECGALEDLQRRHQLGRSMAELVERPLQAWAMLGSILSRLG